MSSETVLIDNLRSLANGSISGSYAAVGTAFTQQARIICITNSTDGDMVFSTDGTSDKLFLAAGTFKLFDLTSNRTAQATRWVFPPGTQFYVKQSTVPTKSGVYIEVLY